MRLILFALALGFMYSCSPVSPARLNKTFDATEKRFKDHTGFVLYDPAENKTIYEFNGDRYFTPASNTKIFTLFAALKILGDSVPALKYVQRGDSLIFWGTGDPSFLYSEVFHDTTVYDFLSGADSQLFFSASNFSTSHFGEGWAWDDYNSGYSPERSPLPLYGNIATVVADQSILKVTPKYFSQSFTRGEVAERSEVLREQNRNLFTFRPSEKIADVREIRVPYRIDSAFCEVLSDTLKRHVRQVNVPLPPESHTLFSIPADSLYSVMIQDSDNFIAEQLLLLCAGVLSDTLKPEIAIEYIKKHHLHDLPDEPVWVDGSGLSRYNLFTPRSIVMLWQKISEVVPQTRLFPLLATGGVNGTIRRWYVADKPYIFGKTGSLSNNHCLSGFLVTKKGKVLIFSFMNSNFIESGNAIRRNMQGILETIREHY